MTPFSGRCLGSILFKRLSPSFVLPRLITLQMLMENEAKDRPFTSAKKAFLFIKEQIPIIHRKIFSDQMITKVAFTLGQNTPCKMVVYLMKKNIFYQIAKSTAYYAA